MQKFRVWAKDNRKEIFWMIVLMGVCFFILFLNRRLPFFVSDEGDNFLGAKMVANGLDVYKEFTSQHMPLMYYVCAIFYLLGARTVIQFRLFFYAFLCLLWGLMYLRYSKKYGRVTMLLYPLLYICVMHFMDFGYCVLSEQLWAQGMVILLLEYLVYAKEKRISIRSVCWISFAIFISFGTAFMAAVSIAILFVGVMYHEIILQVKEKNAVGQSIKEIWKRNWKLILIILIPFIVLILWYLISGNLYNAYYGSFVVNREYYPRYMTSIQSTKDTLLMPFMNLRNWVWQTQYTEAYVQIVIFGLFLVWLVMKKMYSASVVVALFTIYCSIRGIDNFHALPFHAVIMMMGAILFGAFVQKVIVPKLEKCTKTEQVVYVGCLIIALAVVCFPLYRSYYEKKGLILVAENESVDAYPEGYDVINELTDKNEKIYECILNPWFYFATDTLPVTTSAVCPWIYEAYHDDILGDLKREKPRIVVYSEDFNVWGNRFGDFAADMCDYFDNNYMLLDGYTSIYVRNDYYEEALAIISE